MNRIRTIFALVLLGCPLIAAAQDAAARDGEAFGQAASSLQQQLDEKLDELRALRRHISEQKIPLSRQLAELETQLSRLRREYEEKARQLDTRTLGRNNLRSEIADRKKEADYVCNLLAGYLREFEAQLHIAEKPRFEELLERGTRAVDNETLSRSEVFEAQNAAIAASLDRLIAAGGGDRFAGSAIVDGDLVKDGTFVVLGPTALFKSDDGLEVGTVAERLNSTDPAVVAFSDPEDADAAARVVNSGRGQMPFDPTLGKAHKRESTEPTLWEHIQKGGPVMVPILGLAGVTVLVALLKWIGMAFVRKPRKRQVQTLIDAVARGDEQAARTRAVGIKGPIGEMLLAGVEHVRQPVELVEEVMYEKVLTVRLKLQRFLPVIRISAAAAPLLGLLGTVAGIINTFKLITVFGSGDVQMLSGGISEALITTEFGLIVAIPALLLHALLSRKARGVVDQMEKTGVAFANQLRKTPFESQPEPARSEPFPDQGPWDGPESQTKHSRSGGNGDGHDEEADESQHTEDQPAEMSEATAG